MMLDRIIVGCSSMAGMHESISEEEACGMVARAVEVGLRNFDVAPHYGLGVAEERLGRALRASGVECRVWTKVGRLIGDGSSGEVETANLAGRSIFADTPVDRAATLDYSAAGAVRSLADSERRLGWPIYGGRVHDPNGRSSAFVADGAFAGLRGRVREVSIGTNEPEDALRALDLVDCVMLANCWNLIDQNGAHVLAECARRRTPVHLAGVYASGLLAGLASYKYDRVVPPDVLAKTDRWRALATEHGFDDLKLVALAFAFQPAAVAMVALGLRSKAEVDETLDLLQRFIDVGHTRWQLFFALAEARGLVAPGALCQVR